MKVKFKDPATGKFVDYATGGSPLTGKKVLLIGDSNIDYYQDEYVSYMEETYGCICEINATAGCTWHTRGDEEEVLATTTSDKSAVGKINQVLASVDENGLLSGYDYIVIMMGTNDWSTISLDDTSADVTKTVGAMRYCLEKLIDHGRNIAIGVATPIRRNSGGHSIPERTTAIIEVARQYSVPVLDLFNEGRIVADTQTPNATNVYLKDGVHMSESGRKQLLRIMGKWIAYQL